MKVMTWYEYVRDLTRGETQKQVADRTGVDQSTISRWKRGDGTPTEAAMVAAFAQGYGRNPLEAFVAADFLTPEEAGMTPDPLPPSLTQVAPEALADEVRRRLVGDVQFARPDEIRELGPESDGTPAPKRRPGARAPK